MNRIIGQEQLQNLLLKSCDKIPALMILCGASGSGKKTIADWFANMKGIRLVPINKSTESIRIMIQNSYQVVEPVLYIIPDADTMSPQAKNALLKVTEEPPNHAHFIVTVENVDTMPKTILSRARVFYMDNYTMADIQSYLAYKYKMSEEEKLLFSQCDTPGEVDLLYADGRVQNFYDYVELVLDNIIEVNISNALKICESIKLKDEGTGYDLKLFWKIYIKKCIERAVSKESTEQDVHYWAKQAQITCEHMKQYGIKSVNKMMLFTDWIVSLQRMQ